MTQSKKGNRISVSGIDLEWHPERGTCTFYKFPVTMMWVDTTLARLMAGMQAMVGTERFALALQSEGRKIADANWHIILQYPDFKQGLEALVNLIAVAGWGRLATNEIDEARKVARFSVGDSWEGLYQKAIGVCWGSSMAAGMLAGLCGRLFAANCWAEQTAFIARGDEQDEFVVQPSTRSVESEIEALRATDDATRIDMAIALRKLEEEIDQRRQKEQELSIANYQLTAAREGLKEQYTSLVESGKALRESEERWQFALEGSGDGVWDWDARTNHVHYSRQWKSMLGYEEHEIRDTLDEWEGRVHPEDRAIVMAEVQKHLEGQTPAYVSEHRILCKDGSYKWVLDRGKVVMRTPDGKPVRIIGTHADISARKKADEERRARENLLNNILQSTEDGILVVGPSGDVIAANQRYRELWRIPFSMMADGSNRHLLEYVPSQLKNPEEFLAEVRRLYNSDEESWSTLEFTDGRMFERYSRAFPVEAGMGRLWSFRDITLRKRAERERMEIERRMLEAQKLESLGVMAGGIAHDFNNLLMAVIGNLDLAMLDLSPMAPARDFLEQAMKASRRASELTRQMLAYSGKGRFVLQNIDLAELVLENSRLIKASIPTSASLKLAVEPGLSPIQADAGQIQQVIVNLVTNASEAIGESAGIISVTTGEQEFDEACLARSRTEIIPPAGRFVYLEVTDTGCGMDEDTQQKLFDPFFTTKFTGRGLGMPAVLGIVRGHQGAIFLDSERGRGSTIRVLFPAAREAAGWKTAAPDAAGRATAAPLKTALIVDDEEAVRDLCAAYVRRLGMKTLLAADGKQALELFRDHNEEIACVVLDLHMPQMDGVSTFQQMKLVRPGVRVILCSGYDEQEAAKTFQGEGLAAFLQKPYRLQDLKEKIAQALRR